MPVAEIIVLGVLAVSCVSIAVWAGVELLNDRRQDR